MDGREQTLAGAVPLSGPIAQSVASPTADPGAAVRSWPGPILSWRLIMK